MDPIGIGLIVAGGALTYANNKYNEKKTQRYLDKKVEETFDRRMKKDQNKKKENK